MTQRTTPRTRSVAAPDHVERVQAAAAKVIEQRDDLVRWLTVKCRPADARLIEERIVQLTSDAVRLGAEVIDR